MSEPRDQAEKEFGPACDSVVPVQIREDLTVFIQGIPHDLSAAEAQKIASVIMALGGYDAD